MPQYNSPGPAHIIIDMPFLPVPIVANPSRVYQALNSLTSSINAIYSTIPLTKISKAVLDAICIQFTEYINLVKKNSHYLHATSITGVGTWLVGGVAGLLIMGAGPLTSLILGCIANWLIRSFINVISATPTSRVISPAPITSSAPPAVSVPTHTATDYLLGFMNTVWMLIVAGMGSALAYQAPFAILDAMKQIDSVIDFRTSKTINIIASLFGGILGGGNFLSALNSLAATSWDEVRQVPGAMLAILERSCGTGVANVAVWIICLFFCLCSFALLLIYAYPAMTLVGYASTTELIVEFIFASLFNSRIAGLYLIHLKKFMTSVINEVEKFKKTDSREIFTLRVITVTMVAGLLTLFSVGVSMLATFGNGIYVIEEITKKFIESTDFPAYISYVNGVFSTLALLPAILNAGISTFHWVYQGIDQKLIENMVRKVRQARVYPDDYYTFELNSLAPGSFVRRPASLNDDT